MTIVVKRINYKRVDGSNVSYYYIYKQWREGNKIKTKYIGKLEDIVDFYLTYYPLIYQNFTFVESRGRDLNPRIALVLTDY